MVGSAREFANSSVIVLLISASQFGDKGHVSRRGKMRTNAPCKCSYARYGIKTILPNNVE